MRYPLEKGTPVRMTEPGEGDVDDTSITYMAGAKGRVSEVEWFDNNQGVTVTIELDCGVVVVCDQQDQPPYPFRRSL